MAWRLRSFGEDIVDAYTHTWAVFFLLFLALLTVLVPPPDTAASLPIKYVASCWCPTKFEQSQHEYANAVCGAAFEAMVQGRKHPDAQIHKFSRYEIFRPRPVELDPIFNANATKDSDKKESKEKLLPLKAPGILFVFALCLRLPHLIRSILSRCLNSINVDQTLLAAREGGHLDVESKQQLYTGLIRAMTGPFQRNTSRTTTLYMLMKVLMIGILLAETVIISNHPLSDFKHGSSKKDRESKASGASASEIESNVVRTCAFPIAQMANVHDYALQCMFTSIQKPNPPEMAEGHAQLLLSAVEEVILPALVVLLVANIVNTLAWGLNLTQSSSRSELGLKLSVPVDLFFLVHMARTNLGAGVAEGLVEAVAISGCGNDKDCDGEPFPK